MYIIIDEGKKTIQKICQNIKNGSLRTCLGLLKSTPIPALLSESTEMTTKLDNKLKTIKYIIQHLYKNTKIGNDIKTQNSLTKFNSLYTKYPCLSEIKPFHYKSTNPKNLKIEPYISGLNNKSLTKPEIEKLTKETVSKYKNEGHIYTDGSLKDNKSGMGIFVQENNKRYSIRLENNADIKTTETIAIKIAIVLAQLINKSKITIFTDSQSACISILTALKHKTNKHYENHIIDFAGHNNTKHITIQWIPGHININGNLIADQLAKNSLTRPTHTLKNELTIRDTKELIANNIREEWTQKYRHMTQTAGRYYSIIETTPKNTLWFKNKNFKTQEIKQITRLRTGHTYNKKYRHRIGLEDSPNCSTCNIPEDNVHIISECPNYETIRNKYQLLRQKTLRDILQRQDETEYRILLNYLKEVKYKI